ncbi:UDP-2,3-diacylglucosamine diphosphatase [Aliidiomarina minuta]|uniref:UDP-2,3-diacylglucosamine hydrolase n=1 Tax=Aliidiomarina minuta TaxID=880057 RepID=A0A432W547_9GAMM|nr:UDP-2,3-diacylglucosamine diphosphatase [Aliidiomarina minuta]RUO25188.1 UDP-2,3-diacylglucosamine diphosphatase [Aliidiomarina minuta]
MITHFISDLHLSEKRLDIAELFIRFLRDEATESDALYILGDLFDAWIGDDDQTDFHQYIIQALAELTRSGTPVYFIHGNRDFLIGRRFARETGIKILAEEAVVDLYGQPTLLMHGDTLCTLDTSYQRFRRIIRNPILLAIVTRLPLSLRRFISAKLRANSNSQRQLTAAQLKRMDATEDAVIDAMSRHQVERLIHGHTHMPDVHHHELPDGTLGERIVLGDWYEHGSILEVTAETYLLRSDSIDD